MWQGLTAMTDVERNCAIMTTSRDSPCWPCPHHRDKESETAERTTGANVITPCMGPQKWTLQSTLVKCVYVRNEQVPAGFSDGDTGPHLSALLNPV